MASMQPASRAHAHRMPGRWALEDRHRDHQAAHNFPGRRSGDAPIADEMCEKRVQGDKDYATRAAGVDHELFSLLQHEADFLRR